MLHAMAIFGNNNKPLIKPLDPLFIHSLDHPGQILVSDIFNGKDFEN